MRSVRFLVDKQADLQPDKVFMFAPEPKLELTYAQLQESSVKLGKQLLKMGIKKGDRVSFFMGNGYQTVKIRGRHVLRPDRCSPQSFGSTQPIKLCYGTR